MWSSSKERTSWTLALVACIACGGGACTLGKSGQGADAPRPTTGDPGAQGVADAKGDEGASAGEAEAPEPLRQPSEEAFMAREAAKEMPAPAALEALQDQVVGGAPTAAPPAAREGGRGKRRARAPKVRAGSARVAGRAGASPGVVLGQLGVVGHGAGGGGTGYGRGVGRMAIAGGPVAARADFDTEAYAHHAEQDFQQVADTPLSTFSADVDTASYANVRRMLREGRKPAADAVRIEEFLNYFDYGYPAPAGDDPVAIYSEVAPAPWHASHRLVHIGIRGKDIAQRSVPARNLVFLLDVSGSMNSADKLPLLQRAMSMLVERLRPQDSVGIVVYAGASGVVLEPTPGNRQADILDALQRLRAGGSTHGSAGIERAYQLASERFVKGGINRVILATDGDFNVGVTSEGELQRLIERKRRSGVFLTVLGFGRGNLKDSTMETLADKGNGNYAYIDSIHEAHKVLVREAGSTLVTIAKDLKLQVEWNPAKVAAYRLIGYDNRRLAARDFNDDKKDAGEIGAGHTVTALYEVVLRQGAEAGSKSAVDPLKYQAPRTPTAAADSTELATVKVRYKRPSASRSRLLSQVIAGGHPSLDRTSTDFRFSAAVAGFGMLLRGSEHRGTLSLAQVAELAESGIGTDPHGDRREMLRLVQAARAIGVDG